jgi:hypothetical protein
MQSSSREITAKIRTTIGVPDLQNYAFILRNCVQLQEHQSQKRLFKDQSMSFSAFFALSVSPAAFACLAAVAQLSICASQRLG